MFTVEAHFGKSSPTVRSVYEKLLQVSLAFGPVVEDPKKTSIHLNRRFAFAAIKTRRNFLILTVKAAGDIDSERITKHEQTSPNRWHHEIKLGSPDDVDSQIARWLRDAYDLSG